MVSPNQEGVVGVWIFFLLIIFFSEYNCSAPCSIVVVPKSRVGMEAGHMCRDNRVFFCVLRSCVSTPELGWRNWGPRPHSLMRWNAGKLLIRRLFLPGSMFWVSTCLQETYSLLEKLGRMSHYFVALELWSLDLMVLIYKRIRDEGQGQDIFLNPHKTERKGWEACGSHKRSPAHRPGVLPLSTQPSL